MHLGRLHMTVMLKPGFLALVSTQHDSLVLTVEATGAMQTYHAALWPIILVSLSMIYDDTRYHLTGQCLGAIEAHRECSVAASVHFQALALAASNGFSVLTSFYSSGVHETFQADTMAYMGKSQESTVHVLLWLVFFLGII
ncbi:hypothetical protein AcW1_002550 [Taiwanofungus camphoratus]|nr:hypothetical protein AcV5_009795 [Antrodia cinnamomea]KAI0943377.1 hypothetical protein AcW1_002550 [Antrodia cinnamomea]